ncbi:MAG: TonB-dependent receptor, partial [Chitinophagia bacterium]|nr:TonB-dependent receptor [Chitinophagia bacterium]
MRLTVLVMLLPMLAMTALAQRKPATVLGRVMDADGKALPGGSVTILGRAAGLSTDDSGFFRITVPSDRPFALFFSHAGHQSRQVNFNLRPGTTDTVMVRLPKENGSLREVVVTSPSDRREVGLIRLDPGAVRNLPSVTGGVEALIKVFVGSNNELTSQYSVRGGNYDENLVYVNDFEVFRPYLVRSGQQEGLSFINPELAGRIQFHNGGFQARYGDRMSSVLDISYRQPTRLAGSVSIGILEQGFHVEGADRRQRFSYLVGARSRTNRSILSAQEVKGSYIPASSDLQGLFNARLGERWEAEL